VLRRLAATAAACAALAICAPATAQYGGPQQIQPTRNALWGELGFFTGTLGTVGPLGMVVESRATEISPMIEGYFGVTDAIELSFQWGFLFVDHDVSAAGVSEDDSAFALGNPAVSAFYRVEMDTAVLRLGVGLALPVADLEEDGTPSATRVIGYGVAQGMRGLWDMWLWASDRLTVAVPQLRLDSLSQDLVWAVEGGMGLMIDTSDDDRDLEVPLQAAVEGGARLGRSFVIGGRFQVVWIPTLDGEDADRLQMAIEPFARVELENAFLYAKLTLNLDEPFGFAFDDHGVWGLHIGGGTRF